MTVAAYLPPRAAHPVKERTTVLLAASVMAAWSMIVMLTGFIGIVINISGGLPPSCDATCAGQIVLRVLAAMLGFLGGIIGIFVSRSLWRHASSARRATFGLLWIAIIALAVGAVLGILYPLIALLLALCGPVAIYGLLLTESARSVWARTSK